MTDVSPDEALRALQADTAATLDAVIGEVAAVAPAPPHEVASAVGQLEDLKASVADVLNTAADNLAAP